MGSEDSVRGSSQTSEGVWTCVSKKYYEFYEGTTPPNTWNHESCSSRRKKHLHPSLNKWHQALLVAASRHENGANYYDEVRVFTIYFKYLIILLFRPKKRYWAELKLSSAQELGKGSGPRLMDHGLRMALARERDRNLLEDGVPGHSESSSR